MTKLHFIKTGLLTTIQDLGRVGHQHVGIPVGGAMDKASAKLANQLVDNDASHPLLEITLLGPTIRFEGDCQVAMTGADLSAQLNGQSTLLNETVNITDGDLLTFGRPMTGCRTYLAVRGHWTITPWLGSYSAATSKGETATPQSSIKKDQIIEIETKTPIAKQVIKSHLIDLKKPIKVIMGPEFDEFSNFFVGSFFSTTFTITADSNRMGYRLKECIEGYGNLKEVISSGVLPGTIQITNAGQPIVLMADAQTTGGYPRFLNVLTPELDRLAQMKPGDQVRFELVTDAIDPSAHFKIQ
ncbi:MAG: biotin-dependent carboxylase-like uncharacterized protein [Roseivirga sp.]|jgi:antagonist of KipI